MRPRYPFAERRVTADPKTILSTPTSAERDVASTQGDKIQTSGLRQGERVDIWLKRIRALLLVTLCATFGVLLIILPWTPQWTDNHLLLGWPGLRDYVGSGFFRGVCSGLGILNLWLGFWEAIHYHEMSIDQ